MPSDSNVFKACEKDFRLLAAFQGRRALSFVSPQKHDSRNTKKRLDVVAGQLYIIEGMLRGTRPDILRHPVPP